MNKNKIYLVINDYSNSGSCGDSINYKAFSTYEKAKEYFNKIKNEIISYDLNYDIIENEENYYCEYIDGEYYYNHELVYIKEMEIE